MHNDHMNEVKNLKNEIKQQKEENKLLMRKVDDLNQYRIKFLAQENKLNEIKEYKQNNNKEEQIQKVEQVNEDLIDFLQEMEKPDPNKNTKLMSTMGMSVAIDKIGSLFEIYRPKEQNNDKKIKEYESNSETSEFDLLDVENGKEKNNKEIEIEEKDE
uniref:Uncharacterized protein n=1 Tax=Meloidogyne hapla TaxID=6305 RepID=A0A1I8BBM6_MELHA